MNAIFAIIAPLFLLSACTSTPAVLNADVRSAETGKVIVHVTATVDPGQSWVQRNLSFLGPLADVLDTILKAAVAQPAATAAVTTAVIQ